MQRLHYAVLFLMLLSAASWLAEIRYFFGQNSRGQLASLSRQLADSEREFRQLVSSKLEQNAWQHLFFLPEISYQNLQGVLLELPQAQSLWMFDYNGRILAENGQPLSDLPALQKQIALKQQGPFVLAGRLFEHFWVQSLAGEHLGSLLFELNWPAVAGPAQGFFVYDRQAGELFLPAMSLSAPARAALLGFLDFSRPGEWSGEISLGEQKSRVVWQELAATGLRIGLAEPSRGVWVYSGFYLTGIFFLVFLFSYFYWPGNSARQLELARRRQKAETLQQLLSEQKKSIRLLEAEFASFQQLAGEPTLPEKVVPVAAEETVVSGKTALQLPRKQFVFIDPLDFSWQEEAQTDELSESVQKLRARAFSPETLSLLQEVSSGQDSDEAARESVLAEMAIFEQKTNQNSYPSFFNDLNAVYLQEFKESHLLGLLESLNRSWGAGGLIYLKYHSLLNCYQSELCAGLSENILQRLYLLPNDPLFPALLPGLPSLQKVDEDMHNNIYFCKRFPDQLADQLKAIRFLPLHSYGLNGYMMVLYLDDDSLQQAEKDFASAEINRSLRQLAPALRLLQRVEIDDDYTEHITDLLREIKLLSDFSRKSLMILQVMTSQYIDPAYFTSIQHELSDTLYSDERVIYLSPEHLVLLLQPRHSVQVVQKLEELLPSMKIISSRFPEEGKNIFSYI